jgi:hypothetical protein
VMEDRVRGHLRHGRLQDDEVQRRGPLGGEVLTSSVAAQWTRVTSPFVGTKIPARL